MLKCIDSLCKKIKSRKQAKLTFEDNGFKQLFFYASKLNVWKVYGITVKRCICLSVT